MADGKALYIHKLSSLQKGLGVKMLNAANVLAKKKGKTFLRLDCSYENERLYGYYVSQEFTEVRRSEVGNQRIALLQKQVTST